MSNLTHSKSKMAAALENARGTIKRAKAETRAITSRAVNSALTVGAGYAVGTARNALGVGEDKKLLIPGTEIEADLALGVALSLAGVVGLADDYSEELVALGSGMLAANLAIKSMKGGWDFDSASRY